MKLSQMQKGERAVIVSIDLPEELKQRLKSLGLVKNELIHICRVGWMGGSFYIKINFDSCIIISKNEAEHIEVELFGKGKRYRWGKRLSSGCKNCCQEK